MKIAAVEQIFSLRILKTRLLYIFFLGVYKAKRKAIFFNSYLLVYKLPQKILNDNEIKNIFNSNDAMNLLRYNYSLFLSKTGCLEG